MSQDDHGEQAALDGENAVTAAALSRLEGVEVRCCALEAALRNVLSVINPKDHRPHAEQILIAEARMILDPR